MTRHAHASMTSRSARFGLPVRLGAAILAMLQIVVGVGVAIADAQPAAGHAAALAMALEHGTHDGALAEAPVPAAPAETVLSAGHPCPFCDYIAAQHGRLFTAAPTMTAPAIGRLARADRVFAHEALPPVPPASSRAPPLV